MIFFLQPLATATLLLADDKNEDFTNSNRKPQKQLVILWILLLWLDHLALLGEPNFEGSYFLLAKLPKSCAGANINML